MTDIVERLSAPDYWISCSSEGHKSENGAPFKAADEITRLRAENERLREVNARNNTFTARVMELAGLASSYLQAAKQVGGCGDGNCVVLRPAGMHTNGGCRCTHDMDRARVLGVARLLGMAQHIAHAAISGDKQ